MNRYKKLVVTILVTGGAFAVNYLINFFLMPFITDNIGTDAYGYVTLAKSFASYAVIVTVALNSYASRYIALEYHNKRFEKANIYYSSVLIADIFLAVLILSIAVVVSFFIESLLKITPAIAHDVRILFILVFLNLFISTSGTAFQAAAYIKNKLDIIGIIRGVSYCIEALCLIVCFTLFSPKVYYVGCGLIAATSLKAIANYIITKKCTPELRASVSSFSLKAVYTLVVEGVWNSLHSLGNLLNSGLDLLVANAWLSSIAMGQISIVKSVFTVFDGVYQLIAQPFQPMFLKDYSVGNKESLLKNLKLSMKVSGCLSNIIFGGFVAFGIYYYRLWIPNQDTQLLYRLTVLAILSSVLEGPMYPIYYIYTLTVKNKLPCLITIIGGACNVLGMWILIKYTGAGVYAIEITTAIVMLIVNSVTNPLYMAKCLKVRYSTFYPPLLKNVAACIVLTLEFSCVSRLISPRSWIELIFGAVICCVLGFVTHFMIVLNKAEFDTLIVIDSLN